MTLADAKQFVREVNERLAEIGRSRNLSVISASAAWYGVDPIHIMRRRARDAWPTILAPWHDSTAPLSLRRSSLWMTAYLAALAPLEWSQFGRARRSAQPCGRFFDGTTISLY
jgi:hypothetical protein